MNVLLPWLQVCFMKRNHEKKASVNIMGTMVNTNHQTWGRNGGLAWQVGIWDANTAMGMSWECHGNIIK